MQCPQCQFENGDAAKFCEECGNKVAWTCPGCEHEVRPSAKFCPECGTSLSPSMSAPSSSQAERQLAREPERDPLSYTPQHLAEKIITSRSALEGERKQVTILFADIKDSTELIRDLDPEDAQKLLDPAIHIMMDAVHRFEGTVNQVLGDGIMSIFGAPIAHEDHAARAAYAALATQSAMRDYTEEVRRQQGLELRIRVGLNSGEVVVRTIGNDLHMDYSAVGPTTHLAARMEQLATPGSIRLSAATLRLVEGLVQVDALGAVPVKGMPEPIEVYELTGASTIRGRLQAAVARGLTQFVGRGIEIEALNQALEQAGTGQGQLVTAVGEAGVGKSRLMYEFVHSHRTQGWLVLESASVSYGKATAYYPVVDLLRHYVHIDEGDDARTIRAKVTGQIVTLDDSLQDTIPALLSLLDALPEESPFLQLGPAQRRQRTLDGLKRILLRESQVQPLVLVFEDLHWHDSESQALLDNLVESLPTAQLLLLVNYRPEYSHGWGSKTYYTQLRLDPLPPESADALLEALMGDDASLKPLKTLLIERTGGNPFFLEESVRTLIETQVLIGDPGIYRLDQALPTIQVPATVQAILAARIDRLPEDEKQLLQTAAVIGTEVPFSLLQAIAEMSDEVLHRSLTHVQAAEFLYETRLFPEREYTFKHALTQNVAYQSLLTHTRRQVHQRIAKVLEDRLPDIAENQPELLAHHYTEAGLNEHAVGYWHKASQRAIDRFAHAEAIGQLTKGLAALERLPHTAERDHQELMLQGALGPALMAAKGYAAPEVEQAYARARELCYQVGDTPQLSLVLFGLLQYYMVRSELNTAQELGERLINLAQSIADRDILLAAHNGLGTVLSVSGELGAARAQLEQSIDLYNPQTHHTRAFFYGTNLKVDSLAHLAHVLWLLGYPEQARERGHDAISLAQTQEPLDAYTLAHILNLVSLVHHLCREPRLVEDRAEVGKALSREHGFAQELARGVMLRGWALVAQEQVEAGLVEIRQGLADYQATGAEVHHPYYLALLAEAHGKAGHVSKGLCLLSEAITMIDNRGRDWWEAEIYRLKGQFLLSQPENHHAEAETCFHQALDSARCQQAKSLELRAATSLARLWQAQDKHQEAYSLLAPVYGWFTEGFDTADLVDAKVLLDELKK